MLEWVDKGDLASYDLIGFIREILPYVLSKNQFLEGTIYHDLQGNVINKTLTISWIDDILKTKIVLLSGGF